MHSLDPAKVVHAFALMRDGKSARKALKAAKIPSRSFYDAVDADADLAQQYARARTAMCDAIADEAIDKVDGCALNAESIAKARVQLDARKWFLSKLAPKRYGDKLGLVGGDGSGPVELEVAAVDAGRALAERVDRALRLAVDNGPGVDTARLRVVND